MKRNFILFLGFIVLCVSNIYAQNEFYFHGIQDDLWSNAANWQDGMKPDNAEATVYVDANLRVDEDVAVANLLYLHADTHVVTVASGCRLSVSGTLQQVSPAHLIVEDGAQLACSHEVSATVQQAMLPFLNRGVAAWHLIASPVMDSQRPDEVDSLLYGEDRFELYRLNARNTASIWERYRDEAYQESFVIENGQGYLYAVGDTVTLQYHGTMHASMQPLAVALDYAGQSNLTYDGWNLVSNPFTCEAYADRSHYVMNADGTDLEAVRASAHEPLPPCTGVMLRANAAGQEVVFSPTVAAATPDQGVLRLTVTNNDSIVDEVLLSFNADDDLGKFNLTNKKANIFVRRDGDNCAILSIEASCELPLHFKAMEDGTFTLTAASEQADLRSLWLVDNKTGADVNLLPPLRGGQGESTASYTFEAKTTDYSSRFKLFVNTDHGVGEGVTDKPFAYFSNGNIVIPQMEAVGRLQIVDLTGRVVTEVTVDGPTTVPFAATAGVYVLRLATSGGVLTQKIVL